MQKDRYIKIVFYGNKNFIIMKCQEYDVLFDDLVSRVHIQKSKTYHWGFAAGPSVRPPHRKLYLINHYSCLLAIFTDRYFYFHYRYNEIMSSPWVINVMADQFFWIPCFFPAYFYAILSVASPPVQCVSSSRGHR